MGTITTDAAPAIGDYGTYAGTLTGSIGNNLIITTKIGNDLTKQDGTLKSAIENGIVQTAEVPIKIYNANSGTLTTASAKMENTAAIANMHIYQLIAGDKVMFNNDTQSFEWTLNEDFEIDNTDWTSYSNSTRIYVAIPINGDAEEEFTISANKLNGYVLGKKFAIADLPSPIAAGKLSNDEGFVTFDEEGVDLTIWDAYEREVNDATGTTSLNQSIANDKSFIITQSGEKAVDANVAISGNFEDNVAVTLNNIRLEKDCYFEVNNGATFDITLIGENEFEMLNLNSPFTKKGAGTWKFNKLNIGGGTYWNGTEDVPFAAEYTINEDIDLKHLSAYDGGKLTIADGKKVNVINENGTAVSIYRTTFNIGKGAILKAESKSKDTEVIWMREAELNIGEDAEVSALGAKNCTALYMAIWSEGINTLNIGKNAKVNLVGGPEGILGYGMQINHYDYKATTNINLDEGATLNSKGIDRPGINIETYDWGNNKVSTVNFKAEKNAKIIAEGTESGQGFNLFLGATTDNFNFDGEGTFEVKSQDGLAMNLDNNNGTINFKGGNISATSGADNSAVWCSKKFNIAPEIKSFKATKGADATLYISQDGTEAKLEDLVADKTKFNDETADGARTITPKPAAE